MGESPSVLPSDGIPSEGRTLVIISITHFGVFIDLSKAFYTLDHNILLGKLQYDGICGTASMWVKSYLQYRSQFVAYSISYQ